MVEFQYMNYLKRILVIFITAFILNIIWENFHSVFYDNYRGGEITEFILLRAALVDAIIIVVLSLPFLVYFKKQSWLIIPIGFVISVIIEWWALGTYRWSYDISMPIIPFLSVGLTPTIQLGLLGYISFKIQEYF